jgi:hypothetical protein
MVFNITQNESQNRTLSLKVLCDDIFFDEVVINPRDVVTSSKNRVDYDEDQWCDVLDDKKYPIAMNSLLARSKDKSSNFHVQIQRT